ncbi:translation initiation factor 2 [Streptomyces sp. NPDC086554]|uniref:translation initiation factor 2 n=1 Tax=Streptomyces sp. NPDC086554 TaxID=3154864 RepID=UPI00342AD5A6
MSGDERITRLFTLLPGSAFGADALSVIEAVGGRTVPWSEAYERDFDLVIAASPKGGLGQLRGTHVLLPHGAGFNKSIAYEGSADSASGLDPAYLRRSDDAAPIVLHALAHPDQMSRLTAVAPQAARSAKVIGDPTLERVLASRSRRDLYRAGLGTGPRTLLALTSTWGPESLLWQRPGLPAQLAAQLPQDQYQLALIVHPNEWSRLGAYEMTQRLEPALAAGMLLPRPRDEWASVLIAADALITDHGSTALYYAAAGDRPVIGACRGGDELIPGSPMDVLLDGIPELGPAEGTEEALRAYRPGLAHAAAQAAFSHQGDGLRRLRAELYSLLDLTPPALHSPAKTLPSPTPPARVPTAFDVHAEFTAEGVHIARHPAGMGTPGHHLAVEHGVASEQLIRSASLLYRRRIDCPASGGDMAWTFDGWALHALSEYPGCRTAAVILSPGRCLLRARGHDRPYAIEVGPLPENGRIARVDPAAALSAVHTWLTAHGVQSTAEARLACVIGERAFPVRLRPATAEEAQREI